MLNFPYYIARRYLFSKKKQNVINIISGVSITGVAVGTMALIVVLSVFNGMDGLIKSLFNSFDPDLKITVVQGKVFDPNLRELQKIKELAGVSTFSEVLEENVLVKYAEKQHIAVMKGVDDNFGELSGVDSMIVDGKFLLKEQSRSYAVVGWGVAYYLSIGLNFITPLKIYIPRRSSKTLLNPEDALSHKNIFPAGIFSVQQEFDNKYIVVPIDFARSLLEYKTEVSAIELKIADEKSVSRVQKQIKQMLGDKYLVKNRFEQHELLYKIMKSEKWAIFFILSFILVIASFNVVASLTMLIIDKKEDIAILQSMGASRKTIKQIFLYEGWLISAVGAFAGLVLGFIICWAQMEFSIVTFPSSGTFVVPAYPVEMFLTDFVYVFLTVLGIGFVAAWYPVRFITRKHLDVNN